jgi:hypothetical protein
MLFLEKRKQQLKGTEEVHIKLFEIPNFIVF